MKRVIALTLMGVLLAGCVSTPTTTPQEKSLAAETLGLGQAPAPQIADRWWTAFGDPQLDALVDRALQGSPTLAAALTRVRTAEAQVSADRALTYPQVTFDSQEQRLRFSKDYIIPPPFGGSWRWFGTTQANFSWSLDLFGKQSAQIAQARDAAQAAALDAEAARLLLAGNVTQAYIGLSRAYALVDVTEEAVKEREGVLSLTAGRVKAGLDTDASTEQSRALLATEREELIRAKAVRETAVHAIAALIGRGADAYNIARPKLNADALALPEALPADLLARRADIAAAQARIEAAMQGREVARKAFYPDINLIGAAGFAAIGLSNLFTAASAQYGLGPAIHLPIFDAGKLRADYAGATAGLDESVADYNEAVVTAVKQTADAITQVQSADQLAVQNRVALTASQASFDLAGRRYRSGLSPQTNVLDAEELLIQARRADASLAADAATARVALLMALGGGFVPQTDNASNIPHQDNDHE